VSTVAATLKWKSNAHSQSTTDRAETECMYTHRRDQHAVFFIKLYSYTMSATDSAVYCRQQQNSIIDNMKLTSTAQL